MPALLSFVAGDALGSALGGGVGGPLLLGGVFFTAVSLGDGVLAGVGDRPFLTGNAFGVGLGLAGVVAFLAGAALLLLLPLS